MLELLAPAGDIESFNTAIASGANAVYLGLDNFNARMKAQNFTLDNIGEVVERAHFYGVKVYVTINTILQNQEIKPLLDMVKIAVNAKVDAFLVQDLGVCKILHDHFKGIVLHASTQMGVHNLYGAKVAQSMGISRVVLSRETKLKDIIDIKNNTSLEIEYFVQGALCVAFSGNCYLSSVEQGASGNRGLCKQLCRLPYEAKLKDKRYSGHLLSARDLCLAPSILELAKAGVCSFKIEGRMRRAGYVHETVSIYRKIIDGVEKELNGNANNDVFDKSDERALKIAFSRGEYLNRAYLDDGVPKIVDKRYSNHIGIEIGSVIKVKPFKQDLYELVITSNRPLSKGDGLKFFDRGRVVASLGVGDIKSNGKGEYSFVSKTPLKVGWSVNLIASAQQEFSAINCERDLPIAMRVNAVVGERLNIQVSYRNGDKIISAQSSSVDALEMAKNAPLNADEIEKQCSKCGGTGFEVVECEVNTDNVFIAKSIINSTRREALSLLKRLIIDSNTPKDVIIDEEGIVNTLKILDACNVQQKSRITFEDSDSIFSSKINSGHIALCPSEYTSQEIKKMCEVLGVDESKVALDLPIIANKDDFRIIEDLLNNSNINTLISENIYGLYFAQKGYNVLAGQGHNIANAYALHSIKDLGAKGALLSLEYKDTLTDGVLPLYDTIDNLPLMTFAHCPYKTIFGNDCHNCTYQKGLMLKRNGKEYVIKRIRLAQCYFSMR